MDPSPEPQHLVQPNIQIYDLPDALLFLIANRLETLKEIIAFLQINKRMYSLYRNPDFWRACIKQQLGEEVLNNLDSQVSDGKNAGDLAREFFYSRTFLRKLSVLMTFSLVGQANTIPKYLPIHIKKK